MTEGKKKVLQKVGKGAGYVGKGIGYGILGAVSVVTGVVIALPFAWAVLNGICKYVLKPPDADTEKEKSKDANND